MSKGNSKVASHIFFPSEEAEEIWRQSKKEKKYSNITGRYWKKELFYPPLIPLRSDETNEENIKIKPTVCAYFGCRNHLRLFEKLCGDYCAEHQNLKQNIFYNGLL